MCFTININAVISPFGGCRDFDFSCLVSFKACCVLVKPSRAAWGKHAVCLQGVCGTTRNQVSAGGSIRTPIDFFVWTHKWETTSSSPFQPRLVSSDRNQQRSTASNHFEPCLTASNHAQLRPTADRVRPRLTPPGCVRPRAEIKSGRGCVPETAHQAHPAVRLAAWARYVCHSVGPEAFHVPQSRAGVGCCLPPWLTPRSITAHVSGAVIQKMHLISETI